MFKTGLTSYKNPKCSSFFLLKKLFLLLQVKSTLPRKYVPFHNIIYLHVIKITFNVNNDIKCTDKKNHR